MSIFSGEITCADPGQIIERLKKATIKEQPFLKPNGIFFLGNVMGNHFKLITFNSPPIQLEVTVHATSVTFTYVKDSLNNTFTILIYALCYPIFLAIITVLLIQGYYSLQHLAGYTFMLSLPYIVNKMTLLFYNRFVLANDDKFFKKLEGILDAKVTRT